MYTRNLLLTFILTFFLLSLDALGQSRWQAIQFDNNVSFSFPVQYKTQDTLGQLNFFANTDLGYLQAVRIPQPQAQIKTAESLIEYYKLYQKVSLEQSAGNLVSDSTVMLGDLYARTFTIEKIWSDSVEVQEAVIVLIDHSVYSFTYAYFKVNEETVMREKESFFSGISTGDKAFEDQLTEPKRSGMERIGGLIGYIFRVVVIGALILAIVLWFLKKYDQVKWIKRIFSLIFLSWGGLCLFLYVGNILFSVPHSFYLLTVGGISVIVGFILHKIKIPNS